MKALITETPHEPNDNHAMKHDRRDESDKRCSSNDGVGLRQHRFIRPSGPQKKPHPLEDAAFIIA